jgi:cholesterol transport system auxiliary component
MTGILKPSAAQDRAIATAAAAGAGFDARRRALRVLAAVALGGCTAIQPPRVESPNLHVLAPPALPKAARAQRDVVVEVVPPRAWPGYDTAQIVYVREPYELDYFAASRWADTPARMLGPLLARALEDAGSFRAVVAVPGAVPADIRVDTELTRLQQNFAVRPSRVELALRVQVTDLRGKRVLATRVFEETEAAPSEDAAGGVAAANAALQRALAAIVDFCIAATASR